MTQIGESSVLRQAMEIVSPPSVVAGQAIASALEFCRGRLASVDDPVKSLQEDDHQAHDYFRYGLARCLAEYLGAVDGTLREVYLVDWKDTADEADECRTCSTTPVSLILHVQRKTAALEALLSCLDAAVTAEYRDLLAPRAAGLVSLLDATLVDGAEVASRTGYGALVASINWKPVCIWKR